MKTKALFILSFCFLLAGATQARENDKRFGLELNGGASLATSKPGGSQLNPGFGFEGTLHYRIIQYTGVYAGWGWNRFGADNSFAGAGVCFEETGYVLGLQFKHPIGSSPLSYYLRGGGLYKHIEIENASGNVVGDTGHGLGFQLGAGIDYNLGKNWSITPGLKFNYLSRDVDMEGVTTGLNHNYLSLKIGIQKRF